MKKNIAKQVSSAIIGCGYWGSIIAHNLREITNNKIYLYDNNLRNLENLNKKIKNSYKVNSLKKIYYDTDIKNIFLITPPSENIKIVRNLIKFKKNIFIEKPAFSNLNEFNQVIKLNKNNNSIIMIGYVYLFNKYIIKIKKILNKKTLGTILFAKSSRENLGPIRTDVDCNYDLATHDISILLYLINSKISLENKMQYKLLKPKISDISTLDLCSKKIKMQITVSWLNPEKIRKLVIIGSRKMLVFNEMDTKNSILIYNQYAKYPKIHKLNKLIFSSKPKIYKGDFKSVKVKNNDPVKDELKHFFNCIKYKKTPITNLFFAKKIITLLSKFNKN